MIALAGDSVALCGDCACTVGDNCCCWCWAGRKRRCGVMGADEFAVDGDARCGSPCWSCVGALSGPPTEGVCGMESCVSARGRLGLPAIATLCWSYIGYIWFGCEFI